MLRDIQRLVRLIAHRLNNRGPLLVHWIICTTITLCAGSTQNGVPQTSLQRKLPADPPLVRMANHTQSAPMPGSLKHLMNLSMTTFPAHLFRRVVDTLDLD
jgi:hypothetical protein